MAYKLRKKTKDSPSYAHVLHKTLNVVVISRCCFAEDGKEMYQNVNACDKRLFLLIKPIVFRRCRCRDPRSCLSSVMTFWKRRNVVLCFAIFYRRFLLSNVLPNPYLFKVFCVCFIIIFIHAPPYYDYVLTFIHSYCYPSLLD